MPDPKKKNVYNRSGSDDPFKRTMYDAIQGTDFFRTLPLLPGAVEIYQAVKDANPIILTAAPKFGATEDNYHQNPHWLGAAYHKRWWVEHILLPQALPYKDVAWGMERTNYHDSISIPDERFICTTSFRKQEFIGRKHSDHQILIDDRRDNCVRWARAGGVAILHTNPRLTLAAIAAYRAGGDAVRDAFTLVPFGGLIAGLGPDVRTWAELEAAADRNVD